MIEVTTLHNNEHIVEKSHAVQITFTTTMKIADYMNNIKRTKLQEVIEYFNTVLLFIINSQCKLWAQPWEF